MRWRAVLEYDGHDFQGWQRQDGKRTVQGELEAALGPLAGGPARVVGAGRTDVGVHATGQVAHFDMEWHRRPESLLEALNATLPRDVAVVDVAVAPPDFHARYSALSRAYRYQLLVRPVRSPLLRRTSYHVVKPLEVALMAEAAERIEGEHDFAAFGRPMTPGGPTVRRMLRCEVRREAPLLVVEMEANAFLRHQVRRTVGLLLDVGRGQVSPEAVAAMVAGEAVGPDEAAGPPVPRRVPAQGLVLTAVQYPPENGGVLEANERRSEVRSVEASTPRK